MYVSGMKEEVVQKVLQVLRERFSTLQLHTGIPICSKRISAADFEQIVDKMVARLRTWGSRNFSFAGRLQLINSVPLAPMFYCEQIMVLPKFILKEINKVCRSFLWHGNNSTAPGAVDWENVMFPKSAGGLGVCDIVK